MHRPAALWAAMTAHHLSGGWGILPRLLENVR